MCRYAVCQYNQWHYASGILLCAVKLYVNITSGIMQSVILLCVIMLYVNITSGIM